MREAAAAIPDNDWKEYVRGRWGNGADLYVTCPPPSQNDYVHQRRHGEYEEGRFRLLLQIRTYSHGLRNRRGARINVPLTPVGW